MSREKIKPKYLWKDVGITDPQSRLKCLANSGSAVEIDRNTPPQRYYRSGVEMIRFADMCVQEGNYEDAYVVYIKFITIFLEKITTHPDYNSVPSRDRDLNRETLRKVIPKAENLKKQLLELYKAEYDKYIEDMKEKERLEMERLKQELESRREEEERKNKMAALATIKATAAAINAAAVAYQDENKMKQLSNVTYKPFLTPFLDTNAQTSRDKTPTVDRSTKPSLLMNDNLALREIVLPTKLMHNFLTLAFNNTMNNKETCGILAGKLERNKLLVTHLLIPKQTGSPDSCVTHNEEDIFDYQDQHNLITLGWIHTHPTQTAFLSSVDLHTHYAYQLMMAEAIAIVCAPKYDETGFFMLTPDYGLDFIANCRETGFHPHPTEPPLYMKAKHYKLDVTAIIEVVDLRKK